jgi:Putative restriction endonuclease
MVLSNPPARTEPLITWEPLPNDFVLPDDPVENIQQPPLAAALTDALGASDRIQPDMLIGSNFGLVATLDTNTVVKAPDWFYVPHVYPIPAPGIRRSYTPYLEGDPVAVVMEFLSAEDYGELSLRETPPYGKLYVYERVFQVPTYITYDPYRSRLQVRRLENGRYSLQPADVNGRFWIPELQLNLGLWCGERLGRTINWLRWWDEANNLLLWSSEQAEEERQRAEAQQQRAEEERQRAEAQQQRAEEERQRAEAQQQRAEEERQRAEAQQQRAEEERQRAEAQQQRVNSLAAKLRELGIDPDDL